MKIKYYRIVGLCRLFQTALEPLFLIKMTTPTMRAMPTRGPPTMRAQVHPLYLHLVLSVAKVSQYSKGLGQLSTRTPPAVPVHIFCTFVIAEPVKTSFMPPAIWRMLL